MNLRLLLPVLGLMSLGGCILITPPRKSATKVIVVKERRDCHPSEYWDGDRCVHKGKGHGKGKGKGKHDD